MLLLNKREERMTVRGGGGHLYKKKILITYVLKKHRKIGHEHKENTGNLILTRTWSPILVLGAT